MEIGCRLCQPYIVERQNVLKQCKVTLGITD
jgi:hypothetical protein